MGVEIGQWLGPIFGKNTRGSAFDKQDYYSNEIGSNFFSYCLFTAKLGQDWSTSFENWIKK